ncbi:hypothetical protein PLESTM_000015300 [Pleodorina starrii]|nr:hypothetical protein PLESTM_000015300 [Pleodorina starrii]
MLFRACFCLDDSGISPLPSTGCFQRLAHARTSRRTPIASATELARCSSWGFAVMAQPEAEVLRHRETQSAKDQPLQQGDTVAPPSPPRASTGLKKTFYKRKLPSPPATEFSSPEGRQLFQEALLEGSMVGFFKLMEQFNTQDEPAFCGLASLAMTLNALSIDPRRTWKGSWRWFHEAMLDCCRPLDVVKKEGITLYQASCLARCNGARVELRPYGSTTLEQFRAEVAAVCRSGEEHIVVSYSRKAFMQTGDGHFSPIGGYHPGRDLVLVLDVARFKYPPHWVPLAMLYDAMSYIDPETGKPRGYMRLASNPLLDSVLLTLDLRSDAWRPADRFVRLEAPALVRMLAAQGGLSGEDIVRRVVDAMPLASLDAFLIVRSGAPLAASTSTSAAAAAAGAAEAAATAAAAATEPPCATPEALATAVRLASEAVASASASASTSRSVPAASPDISEKKTSCGGGSSGDSGAGKSSCGSCGSSGVDTDDAAGSSGGGSGRSTSSLMAAAAAVFTAQDRCIPLAQRQQLLDELRGMPLYTLVNNHLAAAAAADASAGGGGSAAAAAAAPPTPQPEYLAEKVTMALLMQRPEVWPDAEAGGWAEAEAGAQWRALTGPVGHSVVEAEASYLREQLQHIDEVLQSGDMEVTCGEHTSKLDCAAHGH